MAPVIHTPLLSPACVTKLGYVYSPNKQFCAIDHNFELIISIILYISRGEAKELSTYRKIKLYHNFNGKFPFSRAPCENSHFQ